MNELERKPIDLGFFGQFFPPAIYAQSCYATNHNEETIKYWILLCDAICLMVCFDSLKILHGEVPLD